MTLYLSIPEFLGQHPEVAEQQHRLKQPWKIPLMDSSGKSQGYRQEVNLRPGLNVLIDDYTLQEDLWVETGNKKLCQPKLRIEMSFMLSAHNPTEEVSAGCNFLEVAWDKSEALDQEDMAAQLLATFSQQMERDSLTQCYASGTGWTRLLCGLSALG
ncbi:MAG: hypothetical protein ACFB14_08000 [Leptolyngbyaceae cyanobacterium]